jgi:CRISPR system Cascade subunit CasE
MYLSRLILNPRSRQVQRDLADPYELHRTLLRGFAQGKVDTPRHDEGAAGVLFRLDAHPQSGLPILLVQSQLQPDWSFLQAESMGAYLLPPDPWHDDDNLAVKAPRLEFLSGQTLAFRLRANPTKRLNAGKGHKGKRIGLYEVDQQLDWLKRKADQSGFRLLTAQTSRDEKIKLDDAIPAKLKPGDSIKEEPPRQMHKLEMFSVQFDGILQVTDPDRFLATIQSGIGSGKAFGFGLLSVAPVR